MIVGFNMDIDGSGMIVTIILSGDTLEIQVLITQREEYRRGKRVR